MGSAHPKSMRLLQSSSQAACRMEHQYSEPKPLRHLILFKGDIVSVNATQIDQKSRDRLLCRTCMFCPGAFLGLAVLGTHLTRTGCADTLYLQPRPHVTLHQSHWPQEHPVQLTTPSKGKCPTSKLWLIPTFPFLVPGSQ